MAESGAVRTPRVEIRPETGWVGIDVRELWRFRELAWLLALRDVKVRYRQTLLGVTWAVIQPLLTMVVFGTLFGLLMGQGRMPTVEGVPYSVSTYCGLVPWMLFATSLTLSGNSLVQNQALVTKVYFPRLILPVAPIIVALVDFAAAFAVLLLMMLVFGVTPGSGLLALPLFVGLAVATALRVLDLALGAERALPRRSPHDPVPGADRLLHHTLRLHHREPARRSGGLGPVALRAEPDGERHRRLPLGAPARPPAVLAHTLRLERDRRGRTGRRLLLLPAHAARLRGPGLMSDTLALRVRGLSKRHILGQGPTQRTLHDLFARWTGRAEPEAEPKKDYIWALRDIDLEVSRGEVVGIIGRNGAGKSTLLRILSRISAPTEGYAEIHGTVSSLLEVGTGFHPELTGRENVYLNGAILGMRQSEIARKFDEIVAFAEIGEFLDTPVKRYSTGMRVRLAFSVAAFLESDVMIIDEVLAVGDVGFRNKCLGKMGEVAATGRSVLFVSHSMPAVEALCHRVIVLDEGRIVSSGAPGDMISRYYELNDASKSGIENVAGQTSDGQLEVLGMETLSTDGEVVTILEPGRDFLVRLRVRARAAYSRAIFRIELHDALGTKVATLSSRTLGHELEVPAGESEVVCVVHDPALAPGNYSFDLLVTRGMERELVRRNAGTLLFVESDFFKSGGLPGECANARCLLRQSWSLESR